MRVLFIPILVALFFPLLALGATFAKEPLFLSKSPVTEGETVLIHAVVSNNTNTKFLGKLTLSEEGVAIGSVTVSLEAGGAEAVSVSWKPVAGSHKVTAKLTEQDGTVVEENSATFTVAAKNSGAGDDATTVESSESIRKSLASISPTAAKSAAPVFSTIDTLRAKAADSLDTATDWAKKSGGAKSSVLGTSTENTAASGGIVSMLWSFVTTILVYIFSILKYLITHAAFFYPILAIGFMYALWRLYKRMRRPSFK